MKAESAREIMKNLKPLIDEIQKNKILIKIYEACLEGKNATNVNYELNLSVQEHLKNLGYRLNIECPSSTWIYW